MNSWLRKSLSFAVLTLVLAGIVPPISQRPDDAAARARRALRVNKTVVGGAPESAFRGASKRAEVVGLRTRTSRTFQNDYGALETEVYTGSIHYLADGRWKEIDNTIERAQGGGYQNRANRYTARLPKVLGAAPIRFDLGNEFVSLDLEGAAPVQAEVQENRATYAGVFPGVDVVYEALSDSLKDSIVLAGAGAQSDLSWKLQHSPSLHPTVGPAGSVDFTNPGGEVALSVAPPLIHDARGPSEGAAPAHAFTLEPGPGFDVLRLSVDETWLADPEREFPVTIDPWIVAGQKDCYIADGSLSNNAFCGSSTIQVGRSSDGFRNRALLRFDMSAFPKNAEVLNAKMGLYLTSASTANATQLDVRALTKGFTDGWATWQSPTGAATNPWTTPGGDFTSDGYLNNDLTLWSGWKRWFVTRMAKDWIAKGPEGNNGAIVIAKDESVTQLLKFSSLEGSASPEDRRPVLSVTWDHGGMGDLPTYKVESKRLTERREQRMNVAGGNLLIHETDFKIKGTGLDLVFDRYYNSLIQTESLATQTPLGSGWSLSEGGDVGLKLFHDDEPSPGRWFNTPARGAAFFGPSGYRLPFVKSSTSGSFEKPPGLDATLRWDNATETYTLTFRATEERYVFSSGGMLLAHKDKNGNKIEFFYNAANKVSSLSDTRGRVTTFTYHPTGQLAAVEDPGRRTHRFAYDAQDPSLLRSYTDPAGFVTEYAYDGLRRLTSITDAEGHQTLYVYDNRNYVKEIFYVTNKNVVPPAGDRTKFTYGSSTAAQCKDRNEGQRQITLADMPLVTEVEDAKRRVTTYCHNELGRVRLVKDAKGNRSYLSYNSDANVTSYIDAREMEYEFTYDQTGNLSGTLGFTSGTGSTRAARSIEYDVDNDASTVDHPGFPALVTDAQGNKTRYEYDDPGNLTKVTQGVGSADEAVFRYGYDARGNLTRISRPPEPDPVDGYGQETQGNDIVITDNPLSGIKTINYPMITHGLSYGPPSHHGDVTIYYDALNRVTEVYDGDGDRTKLQYDWLDRVASVEFTTGGNTSMIWYTYDKVGNLVKRDDYRDNTYQTSTYTYDVKNQPKTETHGTSTSAYGYDEVGNLASVTKNGETTSFEYDAVNLLLTIFEPDGQETTFTYDEVQQRRSVNYPNGVTVNTDYNHTGEVKKIVARKSNGDVFVNLEYGYDRQVNGETKDQQLLQKVADNVTSQTTTYTYDALNRLTEALRKQGTSIVDQYQYKYDRNSNLTRATMTENVGTPSSKDEHLLYGDRNEVWCVHTASSCPQGAGTRYTYRGAGGVRSSNTGLVFSYANQFQTSIGQGSKLVRMQYRDMTQEERVDKTTTQNGSVIQRVASHYDLLGLERDVVNWLPTTYIRDSDGKPLAQRTATGTGTTKRYYVKDRLGSVIALTDGAGEVTKRYTYDPYGNGDSSGTDTLYQPWRFAGGYFDDMTGFYKFGVRYYDPAMYRFTQMDPVMGRTQNPTTFNPYLYAAGDPINNVDRTGRDSCGLADAALVGLVGGWAVAASWAAIPLLTAGGIGATLAGLTVEFAAGASLDVLGEYVFSGCSD